MTFKTRTYPILAFILVILVHLLIHTALQAQGQMKQKGHALKIELFSSITGNITLTYEHSISAAFGLEGSIGLIELGVEKNHLVNGGVLGKFGSKILFKSDKGSSLKGGYLKP